MNNIDYIIDFAAHIGQEMLACGANLERVTITMETICRHYHIHDLGIHALSTMINISGTDDDGNTRTKTVKVISAGLNMERLKALNDLSRKVVKEKPEPSTLSGLLDESTKDVKVHNIWVTLGAFVIAMIALARLFGGGYLELIWTAVNTVGLFFLSKAFSRIHLNKIITNFVSMIIAGSFAGLMSMLGLLPNYWVVVLTNAFFLIPGIPMVNSVRNLLCGNEMNGIIDLFKVALETLAICAGLAASYFFFETRIGMLLEDSFPPADLTNIVVDIELVVLSFLASFGFGLTFNISWKEIAYAGIGAMLVRIVLISMILMIPDHRFIFMLIAALCASIFSEVLAMIKKRPATYYLYPFVVPLIPGDLFAFTIFGIWWQNGQLLTTNGANCLYALMGISVGFVIGSTIMHFIRKIKLKKLFPAVVKK